MPYLETKTGIRWHYTLKGEGEPLLFLHGWGVDSRIWIQQAEYFSQNYKVLTIDLPGCGQSSWQPVGFDEIAKEILEISDQLQLTRFHFVGSSMGGLIGLKMFKQKPREFRSFVFVGALPKFLSAIDYPCGLAAKYIEKLIEQLKADYPSIVHIFFRSLFTMKERESERFRWLQSFKKDEQVPLKDALVHYLDALKKEDERELLPQLQIPALILNGTNDYICSMLGVDYLESSLPDARVELFFECGHFPFLTRPSDFNQMLESFLKDA